ncbi:serine/threonine-protein phosphatase 6 regulatory ankyrin repeat subunit B-like [Haliotis rufescens]|uniref:serine/threonine-protein phosphatase 6 regulatory ankyrin repeat subunit B-like n=1 Tax=Haliotis rufescens TaxID=6454 RepID=UPI00201F6991|nr:serine/threonine-protein phosphatase 6 regulatory ankyrin repeat subunit B-like [Haliotis rufescens]
MEPLQDQDQTDRDVGLLLTEVLDEIDRGPQQGRHPTSTSSTQQNYYQCPVSQTNISNASNVSVGDLAHRGCLSQENLTTRIDNLKKEFIHVHALEVAEELLKKNRHIAINGAPGDGKTSIALMLCDTYLEKRTMICLLSLFGSVTLPSSLEAIHKVFSALVESVCVLSVSQPDKATSGQTFKLHFLFTSRTNNWNEGCSRLHQFKGTLFSSQVVVDLTKKGLSEKEKESILTSFMRGNSHFDISQEDMKAITQIQNSMFGFPLTCRLYVDNTVFHMKTRDFFQHPVTYLRGDLDNIVREQSSRSFALILLILCGGKLDLVSFQLGIGGAHTALFRAVKEVVPLCTPTDIGNEIRNFIGSYCRVENNVASFSHPSIYDAAACALGNINPVLLLKHCSMKFLYERVRQGKHDQQLPTITYDVTNMIYITSRLFPIVLTRLVEGIQQGCFRWTLTHPLLRDARFASLLQQELADHLQHIFTKKDNDSGECFFYYVILSDNDILFTQSLEILGRRENIQVLSVENRNYLYDGLFACVLWHKLRHLEDIIDMLQEGHMFDVNWRKGDRTLLMFAAESGHLDVFNVLLNLKADVLLTDKKGYTCLHHACKSGSKDVSIAIVKLCPDLMNVFAEKGLTAAMLCCLSGQNEVLKELVRQGGNLSLTDNKGRNCLHLVCESGPPSTVKYLISLKTTDINTKGWLGQTPAMIAALNGHSDVYNLLVSEGADLSHTDGNNNDCLMLACMGGSMPIVKHLLPLKLFDINKREGLNKTPVLLAAERGHSDVYNLLVSEAADLSLTDDYKHDCLMLACMGGSMPIVKHLLSLKTFDINARQWCNKTPVMLAAQRGHVDVYNLLVSEGADFMNKDCLMLACEGGSMPIVKHLLSLKTFDINRKGKFTKTPVMLAAMRGHLDLYNLLVSEGADLSLTDKEKNDCLKLACERGSLPIVKHLLSLKTFDINRTGWFNQTPVMSAAYSGHLDVYNLLVSEGANLQLTDALGKDCLMLACEGGSMPIVKHLLSLKTFDINRRGRSNQTPVMLAAERGHVDVSNLLVSEGADLSLTDEYNNDCLMLACEGGNMPLVKYLLSLKTFDINRRGRSNQTPVMLAAAKGHVDVSNLLVSEGADLSLTDDNNNDCLMLACKRGNMLIVKHLLSLKTFDINRRGWLRKTPVIFAAEMGHVDVRDLLVSEGADLTLTAIHIPHDYSV